MIELIISILIAFFSILLVLFLAFFVYPIFYGAPFEPTSDETLKKIIKFSKMRKSDKIVDLGSGNGKKGFEAHGIEINPLLVWHSKMRIKKLGLQKKAFIHYGSFWNKNLKNFDVVVTFQINYVMGKLERKLKEELNPNSRIISNTWKFPNLKLMKHEGDVYLYEID